MHGGIPNSFTTDEQSPLLQPPANPADQPTHSIDYHHQFCNLVGMKPHTWPPGQAYRPHPSRLYPRAVQRRRTQCYIYALTTTLINGLLLLEIVLGAALTALGASNSSRILITVFGALNTVIAGLIAVLKSRGLPLRARMFRDDLDRVVNEIESSAVMWLGISSGVHGYSAIDTIDQMTIRGEVTRVYSLYDRAIRANTNHDPDLYANTNDPDVYTTEGATHSHGTGLPAKIGQPAVPVVTPLPTSLSIRNNLPSRGLTVSV